MGNELSNRGPSKRNGTCVVELIDNDIVENSSSQCYVMVFSVERVADQASQAARKSFTAVPSPRAGTVMWVRKSEGQ